MAPSSPRSYATTPNPTRCSTSRDPTRCAGTSCRATSFAAATLESATKLLTRRSRDRFWGTDTEAADTEAAIDTLYTVLHALSRVIAPYLPMVSEEIWTGLTPNGSDALSVHLQEWPAASELGVDTELVSAMDRLRDAASAALSLREDRGLRVRLPLASATVAGEGASSIAPFVDLLADEINVKEILFSDEVSQFGTFRLQPDGRVLGPKLGKDVQTVIKAAKAGDWVANEDGTVTVAGHTTASFSSDASLDGNAMTIAFAKTDR